MQHNIASGGRKITRRPMLAAAATTALLVVAAAVILAGVATWTTSTTHARVDTSAEVQVDPSHMMMMNAKDLPNEHYVDYSLEFPGHN